MQVAQTILNSLQIASPCSADWASMSGSERIRFCAQCDRHVYELSSLSASEALMLIREKEGRLCVRLWRRADGTVLTADCPVGRRRLRERRIQRQSAAAMAVLAAAMLNLACQRPKAEPTVATAEELILTVPKPDRTTVAVGLVALAPARSEPSTILLNASDWEHLPLH